jgi:hypothetical protein
MLSPDDSLTCFVRLWAHNMQSAAAHVGVPVFLLYSPDFSLPVESLFGTTAIGYFLSERQC